jgi:hemerythrin
MGNLFLWRESFAIGHPGLDDEHQRMVALINDIAAAVEQDIGADEFADLVQRLRGVTIEHFQHEDAILWELRSGTYPGFREFQRTPPFVKAMAEAAFDEHMAEHEAMLRQMEAVKTLPRAELCETLKTWFVDHAIKHDSHLKAIFQAM